VRRWSEGQSGFEVSEESREMERKRRREKRKLT